MSILLDDDMKKVLIVLNEANRNIWIDNKQLEQKTELSVENLNDTVELLESKGLVKSLQILGTAPYKFKSVQLTALGKSRLKQGL